MRLLRDSFGLVRQFIRPYLVLNALYYGLIVAMMIATSFHRDWQTSMTEQIAKEFKVAPQKDDDDAAATKSTDDGAVGALVAVGDAYKNGKFLKAIALTFAVNLIGGSVLFITLPSLVIPFAGLLAGAVRAMTWGVMFSPHLSELTSGKIVLGVLVGLLILLEGNGYVLAMLAAYVQGKALLAPTSSGATGRLDGYWIGIKRSSQLYVLVALQLGVAAIYEATLVIFIRPLLV